MKVRKLSSLVALALVHAVFIAALAIAALAQITMTGIRGIVRDPNGAVVPNATVKATDNATGVEQTTISSSDGGFIFPALQFGSYKLAVTAAGFQNSVIAAVVVESGRTTNISVDLTIGAAPAQIGERRQFLVRYRGIPANGLRMLKNKFGERVFFSENWPNNARQWLPMIDHPYDKATSEFIVTAPAKYQVVANGLLQEETDLGDGRRLTHWKQSVPIASWLNALGIAQFAVHHDGLVQGVPHQTWVFHQERATGPAWFETKSRQAMEFFSDRIGPYSYEKLANVEAAGFGGGTEHASAIFYGEKSILERPDTGLIAHEIAHQWFGNSATEKDWDDVWLSEGFATYFTLLVSEHYEGRDAFVAGLKRSRAQVFTLEKQNPGVAVLHDNLSDMKKVLNRAFGA